MHDNIFPINQDTAKSFIEEPVFQGHIGQTTAKSFEENHLDGFLDYLNNRQDHWTPEKIQRLIFAIELMKYAEENYRKDHFPIYYDNAVHYLYGLAILLTEKDI